MPRSRGRRKRDGTGRRRGPSRAPRTAAWDEEPPNPPIDGLVRSVLESGRGLPETEDPLEAELWASWALGTFYKLPIPLPARDEPERVLVPSLLEAAEAMGGAAGLAAVRALAAVLEDDDREDALAVADRLAASGAPEPPWAGEIGRPAYVDGWWFEDPYGDQRGYFASFRYPGRPTHTLMALYDENLGGIIKDAFAGVPLEDARRRIEDQGEARVADADPGEMASRLIGAIRTGDLYLDNDWTDDFRYLRALLLARMRLLPAAVLREPEPLEEEAREALLEEFLASPEGEGVDRDVARTCLDVRCDHLDGDPLRWSPIVVELLLLDTVPRKVTLDATGIRLLPDVMRRWVRFALGRRGLEERWVAETEEAVRRHTRAFRKAATDPSRFGPAKAIAHTMMATAWTSPTGRPSGPGSTPSTPVHRRTATRCSAPSRGSSPDVGTATRRVRAQGRRWTDMPKSYRSGGHDGGRQRARGEDPPLAAARTGRAWRGDRDREGGEARGQARPLPRAAGASRPRRVAGTRPDRAGLRRAAARGGGGLPRRTRMRLLLDTHALLWRLAADPELSEDAPTLPA